MTFQSLMGCFVLSDGYLLLCPAKACLFRVPAGEVFTKAQYLFLSRMVCTTTSLLFLLSVFLHKDTASQACSAAVDAYIYFFFPGYCSVKELKITLVITLDLCS